MLRFALQVVLLLAAPVVLLTPSCFVRLCPFLSSLRYALQGATRPPLGIIWLACGSLWAAALGCSCLRYALAYTKERLVSCAQPCHDLSKVKNPARAVLVYMQARAVRCATCFWSSTLAPLAGGSQAVVRCLSPAGFGHQGFRYATPLCPAISSRLFFLRII